LRVLLLGGTTEANLLAEGIAHSAEVDGVLSLAGRTKNPSPAPIPCRIGGFGGVAGLCDYLREQKIEAVVDATHPFAAQMSAHALEACRRTQIPLVCFTRPPWVEAPGDRWIAARDMAAAVRALGAVPSRVFLSVGRLSLGAFAAAPQHFYVVRAIDAPEAIAALPSHRLILERGPFSLDDEEALLRDERIAIVVSKNSGGSATYAKIEAARRLGLPVVMVARPKPVEVPALDDVEAVLAWLHAHRP